MRADLGERGIDKSKDPDRGEVFTSLDASNLGIALSIAESYAFQLGDSVFVEPTGRLR